MSFLEELVCNGFDLPPVVIRSLLHHCSDSLQLRDGPITCLAKVRVESMSRKSWRFTSLITSWISVVELPTPWLDDSDSYVQERCWIPHAVAHLILRTTLWGRCYNCPHSESWRTPGNSLAVQWLGLCDSTSGGPGFDPRSENWDPASHMAHSPSPCKKMRKPRQNALPKVILLNNVLNGQDWNSGHQLQGTSPPQFSSLILVSSFV